MFDETQYAAFKAAGTITSTSISVSSYDPNSGNIVVTFKTFCPNTGAQLADGIWTNTVVQLTQEIATAAAALASMQALLADATA
jgi:hypothetical protein